MAFHGSPPYHRSHVSLRGLQSIAIGVEIVLLASFLLFPPLAGLLGQGPPPPAGWLIAALAAPAVLAADLGHKRWVKRRIGERPGAVE